MLEVKEIGIELNSLKKDLPTIIVFSEKNFCIHCHLKQVPKSVCDIRIFLYIKEGWCIYVENISNNFSKPNVLFMLRRLHKKA